MSFLGQRRGIIFDLDNTLIPTSTSYRKAVKALELDLVSLHNATDGQLSTFASVRNEVASSIDISKFNSQSEWFRNTIGTSLKKVMPQIKDHHISKLYHVYMSTLMEDLLMTKPLIDMLARLHKDYKLAILTNGFSYIQNLKLERCNAREYFDVLCVSGDHKMMKPDPSLFHLVCRKLGLTNAQCVMVGDNLFTDILGAQNAGLKSNIYLPGVIDTRERNFEPAHVIHNILDVENVLEKLDWN